MTRGVASDSVPSGDAAPTLPGANRKSFLKKREAHLNLRSPDCRQSRTAPRHIAIRGLARDRMTGRVPARWVGQWFVAFAHM